MSTHQMACNSYSKAKKNKIYQEHTNAIQNVHLLTIKIIISSLISLFINTPFCFHQQTWF